MALIKYHENEIRPAIVELTVEMNRTHHISRRGWHPLLSLCIYLR